MNIIRNLTLLVVVLFLGQNKTFASTNDDIDKLDLQRNELVRELTTNLVNGKITIEEAQHLKNETDNIIKLESVSRRDPNQENLENIKKAIQKANIDIHQTEHPDKVWFGIDGSDKTLQQQISDALAAKRLTQEQAIGLKKEADELRARCVNGDATHSFEFNDAISIAVDLQTLEEKINGSISARQ